ncbi:MerR family transcriptional regulator [Clostridium manihotivorum]|uniref:MerR family transcriptional regulator n=1 Tax=Clostridium manihotivorum TaxID=2320868 RepID=A0A410DYW8_9CLOT|nr:MerR family transcriptional regulator [Clostridium manihotivorum]QAA34259.1 MerR family transcriptional regulator [Clostridium manihotivorum]
MDIGEFSKSTGISIDTLRYYDKLGVLTPRRVKARRDYGEVDVEKAFAIIKLKKLNFSLEEIKALFKLEDDIEASQESLTSGGELNYENSEALSSCIKIVEEKYREIERQEEELRQVKLSLGKMIDKANKLITNKY